MLKKGCFSSKREKSRTIIEFCIFELVLVPNFSWNYKFWLFCPNLPKIYFLSKTGTLNSVRISLGNKFRLKLTILIFWTKFFKKECFSSKIKKVNTTIEFFIFKFLFSLCAKFQLKLASLMFWTKFAKKQCFLSKTEKVNTAIEFGISELVLIPKFKRNWQCLLFLCKFAQHGILRLKQEHWTVPMNSAYWN